jgi:hypothetical protein
LPKLTPPIHIKGAVMRNALLRRTTLSQLGAGGGAVLAAAAVAAAAWHEVEHRRVAFAEFRNAPIRVSRLSDLRNDAERLALIDAALRKEWGHSSLLGFSSVEQMLTQAGSTIFIAQLMHGDQCLPVAALQTTLVDVGGDPQRLLAAFPSFAELSSAEAMHNAAQRGGDTAVLLQIAVFDKGQRGMGIGSHLRDAGLNLLDASVKHALTITPVDLGLGDRELCLDDPSTFTPAMRFHGSGGAEATLHLSDYKRIPDGSTSSHGSDVVVMRYSRDARGFWPLGEPSMLLHRVGPLQERLMRAQRWLTNLRLRQPGVLLHPDLGHL